VLFVARTDKEVRRILGEAGPGVLTVGEGEKFLQDGGIIAFVIEDRRVRFDIASKRGGQSDAHHQFKTHERSEVRAEIGAVDYASLPRHADQAKAARDHHVVTTAALLLSGIGIVIADSILFRAAMRTGHFYALAQIVADNSTAALAFNDPQTATQTLASLKARAPLDCGMHLSAGWHSIRHLCSPSRRCGDASAGTDQTNCDSPAAR
jgi:hypothetical protein